MSSSEIDRARANRQLDLAPARCLQGPVTGLVQDGRGDPVTGLAQDAPATVTAPVLGDRVLDVRVTVADREDRVTGLAPVTASDHVPP